MAVRQAGLSSAVAGRAVVRPWPGGVTSMVVAMSSGLGGAVSAYGWTALQQGSVRSDSSGTVHRRRRQDRGEVRAFLCSPASGGIPSLCTGGMTDVPHHILAAYGNPRLVRRSDGDRRGFGGRSRAGHPGNGC